MSQQARRTELGTFLRNRRQALTRQDFGLPTPPRARTSGLRREEVSTLAGVSVTWLTWLEQGRDVNPSRQVLEALGRVLRLTASEAAYLLSLGGYSPRPPDAADQVQEVAPPSTQRLLNSLPFPAFAVAADWTIVGWNAAYAALYSRITTLDPADRNLLWLVFTDPHLRDMLPDWTADSRHFVAEFRAESGARLGSAAHSALIARLSEASAEFREQWADLTVEGFTSRRRRFVHPTAGVLDFEHHRLVPSDHPDLHIVAYVPEPGSAPATWIGGSPR
ncbi:helix-turn-helix transcriptional regulator [Blastococcus xanthinilyticus]|uniref:Helix-turn-helix protein n=1 Tax=Blastococcus xanthinilyticus TaxID=1564164 RepID=A0A5S5CRD9_9ACTN|nr:helix-turn-helix transcriptional regulator [Blastococcus xanthinilyticus]TYP84895.1 helix-turn-helix protein [Blastococcus xanthinilyticus]